MTHNTPNIRNQNGAALVIGLILLLVLTILGVSGLGSSTLQIRMSDNAKQRDYAFHGAESALHQVVAAGVDFSLDGTEVLDGVVVPNAQIEYNADTGSDSEDDQVVITVDVETRYRARHVAASNSENDAVHFEIVADAASGRGARSVQRQGYFIIAPRSTQ